MDPKESNDAGEVPHLSSFVPNWLTIVCPKEIRGF